MTSTATGRHASTTPVTPAPHEDDLGHPGPLGRLGVAVTHHRRLTAVVWLLLVVGLGAFAPKVEAELSGAGWQADGSESVAVRELAQTSFGGNASSAIRSWCTAATVPSPRAPPPRWWPRPRRSWSVCPASPT